jgi:hypothetical protein
VRAGLLGLLLAALLWAAPAQAADVVGNPGLVTLTAVPAGSVNGLALDGFTAQGTVDPDGELLFPSAGTTLPEGVTPSYDDGSLDLSAGSIEFTPTLDATGTIDPAAGASTLLVPARAALSRPTRFTTRRPSFRRSRSRSSVTSRGSHFS